VEGAFVRFKNAHFEKVLRDKMIGVVVGLELVKPSVGPAAMVSAERVLFGKLVTVRPSAFHYVCVYK
jgi:hypothetical protein